MQLHTVPIFPLTGLVLFPRTLITLHIFEPRYKALVERTLETDRRMATANIRPGSETNEFGKPRVYRTITIARILHDEKLEDGTFNILLEGIERALVDEELEHEPYRIVKARSLVDIMSEEDRHAIQEAHQESVALANEVATRIPDLRSTLTNLDNIHLHPGIIADQIAAALIVEPYERQGILEERNVLRRIQLVNVQMRAILAKLEGKMS